MAMATSDGAEFLPGTKIQVTVQSLHGIEVDESADLPQVSAMVAFTGSASKMEVGSSTLCPRTGHLLIESTPLHIHRWHESPTITAHWPEEDMLKHGPHLTVHMPYRDPALPKAPLTKSNRGSEIVRNHPCGATATTVEENETASTAGSSVCSSGSSRSNNSSSRGQQKVTRARSASAFWSNSGAALPEYVELSVRLQSEDRIWHEGIAYLVLFGNDSDRGMYIMDLPVRHMPSSDGTKKSDDAHLVTLAQDARLRLRIDVFVENDTEQPQLLKAVSSATSRSTLDDEYNNELDQCVLAHGTSLPPAGVLEEVRVAGLKEQTDAVDEESISTNRHGTWSWEKFVRKITDALQCNGGGFGGTTGQPNAAFTDASTIATRESMGLRTEYDYP